MVRGRGLIRRVVSGVVAGAMVFVMLPLGPISAASTKPAAAKPAPPFAALRGGGLDANLLGSFGRSDVANVRWRKGVSASTVKAAARRLGFTVTTNAKLGWSQLTPGSGGTSGEIVSALREAGLVVDAKPTVWMQKADVTPNDPLFSSQWALKNTGQDGGTAGNDINVSDVWSRSTGSKDVIVAVVDEGVNWAHPDLKNNMWINTGEVPNNGIDDDQNGYVDDVRGWDFANGDNTVYDAVDGDRHGTHVSGIIGAQGNNGVGATGVNQTVRIMPVKFLGPNGGTDYDGAEAIIYAVDRGATVINCSWGGFGFSDLIAEAIDYATSKGVIIVCAAGNSASDNDVPGMSFYPASSDATNVITVAASDRNGAIADFSNYGSTSVDLAAPGVDVTSTMPAGDSGTFVDGLTWKAVYIPLQAEVLEPAPARDALIAGAVAQLGEPSDTPILVVDDSAAKVTSETPGVRLKVYTDALAAGGFSNVTTWVNDDRGTPTVAAMSDKTVVWFTGKDTLGYYGTSCLNTEEQDAIRMDLDAGGRVVLFSGKAASDLQMGISVIQPDPGSDPGNGPGDEPGLLARYFGAVCVGYETWSRDFHGRASSALAGIDAWIPVEYTDPNSAGNLWPTASDAIARVDAGFRSTAIMYTGSYAPLSGTSMAAPHVTGAVALLKACLPAATGEELAARIINTAAPKPAFKGRTATGGVLDVAAAFGEYPGRVTITAPKSGDRLPTGMPSTLRWKPAAGAAAGATFTAEVGLPFAAYANGFESGTLAGFVEPAESGSAWSASTDATATRTGAYGAKSGVLPASAPAPEMGPGWFKAGVSAMQTTITVPAGGGRLSFYWRMPDGDGFDQMGMVNGTSDGAMLSPGELVPAGDWAKASLWLPEGEQPVYFVGVNFGELPSDARLYIDDIELTAHEFTGLGSAGAGATSLDFTVPSTATDDAWFRVQSHLNGVDSAWATVKGVALISDSTPPTAPSALTLTPDLDGNVGIAWANPTAPDYASTLVLASIDRMPTGRDDASATVAYEGTGTVATFGPAVDGREVYVSAWAVDESGNWSVAATAQTTAVDHTAPAAPRALRAVNAVPGLPTLYWAGADVAGNALSTVLRSYDSTPGVGDPDAMLIDSWFGFAVDEHLDPDVTQAFYTVYLTDPSGNVSPGTSMRLTIDPAGVTGGIRVESEVQVDDAAVVESSTVSVIADVTNATSMRVWINDERDADAEWLPFAPQFDVGVLPIQGTQRISAEFRSDPMSEPTEMTVAVVVVLHEPVAPTGLTAVSSNTGVMLSWDIPEDPTIAGYRVYEALTPFGPWMPLVSPGGVDMTGSTFFAAALAPAAPHFFKVTGVDVLGREGAESAPASANAGIGVVRFAGSTRAGTAVAASAARYLAYPDDPYMSDTVVIASDSDYVQALAANSLAGSLNAPVLLAGATLPRDTAAEVRRLKVKKAYVVGTTRAVGSGVDAALKALGLHVERISGTDGYDVAAKVARRLMAPAAILPGGVELIVVNGTSPSDMCSLMPVAYSSRLPIVILKGATIPAPFKTLLAKTEVSGGTVIGGKYAVATKTARAVFSGGGYDRLWGSTAIQTSGKLAEWAVGKGYSTWQNVGVANGANWGYNLAIGAATRGGVVLLNAGKTLDPTTAALLRKNAPNIQTVSVFGGTGTATSSVFAKIRTAMSAHSGPVALSMPFPPPFPEGM